MPGKKETALKEELAKKAGMVQQEECPKDQPSSKEMWETGNGSYAIRLLRADEIECRVSAINEKGVSLLLFKDARVDQRILDETFTPFGWKRTHQSIEGNLYCTVEVWDESKGQWIAKQDVGTESYTEKEKGQASDSFKRACFNWGVGRELYTAPFIWVSSEFTKVEKKGDRYICKDRFRVQSIAYNARREISALSIINRKGQKVYELKEAPSLLYLTPVQLEVLEKELVRTGVSLETVLERYHVKRLEEMTAEVYAKALNSLKKTKTREAA